MDATAWNERYQTTDRLWSLGPNVFVEDRLRDRPPGTGLDLASGEGRNAIWLASQGWQMTAVDFSAVAVERGRARSDQVDFIQADVFDWQPGRTFDLVLIAYLQVEADRLAALLERVKDWLEPGAELFLIGHDRSNIEHGVGGPQEPEILWDVGEVVGWLGDLEIIEAGVVDRRVEIEGEAARAKDALIRARAVPGRTRPV